MTESGRWLFLSHVLESSTPGFSGESGFAAETVKSMANGDSCNQSRWQLSNHIGTHIDAPAHFSKDGQTIDSFAAGDWIFHRPWLVNYAADPGELIEPAAWCGDVPETCDLLLLRTGFEGKRSESIYWRENPGLAPTLADWLRENRPAVRAIGVDFLSVTSFVHREIGREAHRRFLSSGKGAPIMLIEDMKLSELPGQPQKVMVMPLRVRGTDGSPVTVIADVGTGKAD